MTPETANRISHLVGIAFFATWIVLGFAGFGAFYLGRNVDFKRKWFPRYVILGGVLFVVFSSTLEMLQDRSFEPLRMLALVVPMVCLIGYLNVKFTSFCGNCGRMVYSRNWLAPLDFCPFCRAKLDTSPKSDDWPLE